jgi:hypothetical protein
MYLSGPDIRPIGCEPAEFLEAPAFAPAPEPIPETPEVRDDIEPSAQ